MRVLILLLSACFLAAAQAPDCSVIPGSTRDGDLRSFDSETLFEYMNGNSEGYFLYGFQSMQGITCARGDVKFIFDVSTFKDFESAYGMFTGNADPRLPVEEIGAAGQVTPRKAVMIKGRYYVEIAAEPSGDHAELLRSALANFEQKIDGRTEKPEQLAWFPTEELQPGFPRLAPQSVLGLRMLTRGYLAQYPFGKAFVVTEGSPSDAQALLSKLRERFPPNGVAKAGDEAFLAQDRYLGTICMFRKGVFVGGWTSVKEADAAGLAAKLAGRLP
jgi:hypothetical protein